MDKATFGKEKVLQSISSILQKDEYAPYEHRACRILAKYLREMKVVANIPDKPVRETAMLVWRHHYLNWVAASNFPDTLSTHLNCVIVGKYREYRERGVLNVPSNPR